MTKKAIVLVSGGMDSCLTAAIAKAEGYEPAFLHLNYGQRTEKKEQECFYKLCDYFEIKEKLVIDTSFFSKIGGSSLTDTNLEVTKANLNNKEIPSSYVPFRNANILSIAVAWAEVIKAERIYIGASEEDFSGYPDCRKIFFDKYNELIEAGTKAGSSLKIVTPLISMNKADIVKKGLDMKIPFNLTWSCYSSEEKACGVCDSCALRLRGFQMAGVKDPIEYKERPNYL